MNKKGFDASQMFIYVVSVVVVGFVLLFGFQSFGTLLESEKEIQLAKFQTDFDEITTKVSADHGSVRFFKANIPDSFSRICLIDVERDTVSAPANCPNNLTATICQDWDDFTGSESEFFEKQNVYFVSEDNTVKGTDYIEDIIMDDPFYVCATPKYPELRLEGINRHVKVSLS